MKKFTFRMPLKYKTVIALDFKSAFILLSKYDRIKFIDVIDEETEECKSDSEIYGMFGYVVSLV